MQHLLLTSYFLLPTYALPTSYFLLLIYLVLPLITQTQVSSPPGEQRSFPDTLVVLGADGRRRTVHAAVTDYATELGAFILRRTYLTCISTISRMLDVLTPADTLEELAKVSAHSGSSDHLSPIPSPAQ